LSESKSTPAGHLHTFWRGFTPKHRATEGRIPPNDDLSRGLTFVLDLSISTTFVSLPCAAPDAATGFQFLLLLHHFPASTASPPALLLLQPPRLLLLLRLVQFQASAAAPAPRGIQKAPLATPKQHVHFFREVLLTKLPETLYSK